MRLGVHITPQKSQKSKASYIIDTFSVNLNPSTGKTLQVMQGLIYKFVDNQIE